MLGVRNTSLLENTKPETNPVLLAEEQKLMLRMSEADIKNGRLISQDQLDKNDLEWLNGK